MFKDFYIDDNAYLRIEIDKLLFSTQSAYQKIEVYDTRSVLGRVLAIDNIVQVSENDYYNYHQGFIEPAMNSNKDLEACLIIGGGDGILANFALKNKISHVTQVEIDQAVIDVCKKFFSHVNENSFDKIDLHVGDGLHFVKETNKKFDLVLCDLTDGCDESDNSFSIFTEDFFKNIKSKMNEKSVILFQTDLPFWWDENRKNTLAKVSNYFKHSGSYSTPVHSYGGLSSYVWASDETIIKEHFFEGDLKKWK
jgi:spermidine synthase